MKTIKKYLLIILLYTTQSYGQYIGSYNSIGSNFIGLSPCLRTMSANKTGDVYYSDICRDNFKIDKYNITPNIGQAGIQQAAFGIMQGDYNVNNLGIFETFAYNVNKSDVGVQEIITLPMPSGRIVVIYNFDQDIISWVDTLVRTNFPKANVGKDIGISVFKDNVRQWTAQSTGPAMEYILSATYDEHENIYMMGWFLRDLSPWKDTVPAQFDTLKFYPPNTTEDPNGDFKNYFIVSYDAKGKLRWGKKIAGSNKSEVGKLTYKQGRGLLFDLTSRYLYIDGKKIADTTSSGFSLYCHVNLDTGGNILGSDYVTEIGNPVSSDYMNGGNHCEVPYSNTVYSLSHFFQRIKVGNDSLIPRYEYPGNINYNWPEIYLAKKVNGQYTKAKSIGFYSGSYDYDPTVTEMQADSMGRVYLLGHFHDTFYLDTMKLTPKTKQDIFLACYDSNFKLLWLQTGHGDSGTMAYASGMAVYGNKVTINGYVNDTFYWQDQAMDHEDFMHMFICRFEVFGTGVKMVDDPRHTGTIKVWPNPANGIINIQHYAKQKEDIVIYNILGELIYKDNWALGEMQRGIDLSSFSKGLYIIRIGDAVEKIIVE